MAVVPKRAMAVATTKREAPDATPPGLTPRASEPRMRALDLLLLAYLGFTSVVALIRPEARDDRAWLLASNALMVVLIALVTRWEHGRFGRTLREIYPLLLLPSLYGALDLLSGGGQVRVYDRLVQGWEQALFGGQPSRDWWRAAPSTFWSTVLHGAYFSYYAVVAVPAVVLLLQRRERALGQFVFTVMVTFVFCYLWFVLLPVAGPYYAFERPAGEFVDNPMARLVYATLSAGSSYGAAFPSSHVAASVASTLAAWRVSRRLGLVLAVPTAMLTIGVVYCQMHYLVDAVAGLVVGAAIAAIPRVTTDNDK
jgi:membrane-associated phospholipid phosphatase